jgi:CubicO group peptidase (beta-lactamase class C family)
MGPAGTVHCTMADWSKFAALHLQGARGNAKLLKAATFQALHTPPSGNNYAGGWLVVERPWAGGRALMHGGSNTTWCATVWLAPARDIAFLVATNCGGDSAQKASDQAVVKLIGSVAHFTELKRPLP